MGFMPNKAIPATPTDSPIRALAQRALAVAQAVSQERLRETREKLLPALIECLHARRVWVFGSTARGTATADSDVDVFVECGDTLAHLRWLDRQALASEACAVARQNGYTLPCDVIVWTSAEIGRNAPFWRTVRAEGIPIYER